MLVPSTTDTIMYEKMTIGSYYYYMYPDLPTYETPPTNI
jgi:hypothetical protein